jgi:hypothetical protein
MFREYDKGNKDPFNIEKQILAYMNIKRAYPIVLLKYGFNTKIIPILQKYINRNFKNYKFKIRENNFLNLNEEIKNNFKKIYEKLNLITKNSPDLMIRFPKHDIKITDKDIIKYELKNNFPGCRIRHFRNIRGYKIFNERDVKPHKYGRICIIHKGKITYKTFEKYGIKLNCINAGVEDPRYFIFNDKIYLIMNGLDIDNHRNMYLYNLTDDIFCKLFINNFDISPIKRQKNWTPYIHLNELFLIYSLKPLCILKVINPDKGECVCIKGDPLKHDDKYKYFGSTPLIQWNYPNYIGFVHTRCSWHPCPIIYDVEKMEIKRIGKALIFKKPPGLGRRLGKCDIHFPYDLQVNNGNAILSIDFEDKCPTYIYINYIKFCKIFSI